MNSNLKLRRGSALLIVLGMLSFMVISAVGFSIYMRQSRVPSSHLRREATARYLLKSALANAVARLDGTFDTTHGRVEGVYDDPYPGLNDLMVQHNGDYWVNRVFTPFGMVDPSETVSTLTLEGLGYIPPALINEVRLRSRTTRTAKWTNLAYDLGRYAFCAVDVSDCFDINKLRNVKRRTAHAGERISLSSLYPDNPDTLVNLLKSKANENEPFVSIGDFNVAVGNSEFTPFVRYINNGGNNGHIYLDDDTAVSNALFITDTWFPATNAYLTAQNELKTPSADASTRFDLSGEAGQPFESGEYNTKMLFELPISDGLAKVMYNNLGPVGLACLFDYLDDNQIPFSLALPTVETAPMVCGFGPIGEMCFKFEKSTAALPSNYGDPVQTWQILNPADGKQHDIERRVESYVFRGATFENFTIVGSAMFPFKRTATDKRGNGSFKAEALVAVCFADSGLRARLTNKAFRPTKTDWQNGGVRDNIIFYKTEPSALSFNQDVTRTDDAFKKFSCTVKKTDVTMPAFYKITETDKTPGLGTDVAPLPQNLNDQLEKNVITVDGTKSHATPFTLFDENGKIATELETMRNKPNADKLQTGAQRAGNPGGTKQNALTPLSGTYRPFVIVWVRITDSGGNTVYDLAPATFADDAIYISGCNYDGLESEEPLTSFAGKNVPILSLKGAEEFKFEDSVTATFDGTKAFEPQGWKAFAAVDPRYNFAPEDWCGVMEDGVTPEKWRALTGADAVGGNIFGKDGRDRDIFMFVSDQKYLQSIGELQFLPFVQRLGQNASSGSYDFHPNYDGDPDFSTRKVSDLATCANGSRFWRTYSGYKQSGWTAGANDPYYDLRVDGKRITVVNGSGDFRVNPLSSDPRVLAAAVFDTPWDYYVTGTNSQNKALSSVEGSPETFAFGTASSISADLWDEKKVAAIASEMRNAFHDAARSSGASFDWGVPYRNFDWECADAEATGDDQIDLFDNVDLGSGHPLHGVDRKFLFSYWRECFQNRQQLFLIFLRAEPLTVGGAGGDSLANSQLGARGVALVWRDPAPPKPTSGNVNRKGRNSVGTIQAWRTQMETQPPHRTRVLFYYQFD